MGFEEVHNVVFCRNGKCRKVFRWDGQTEGGDLSEETVLPCGHRISEILFAGSCIRDGRQAINMLEYLDRNELIKPQAYDLIKKKGGSFDDGLNFTVPGEDLTEDERSELEW